MALAAELGGAPRAATPKPGAAPTNAPPGITIGKIEAVNLGETQIIDQQGAQIVVGDRNVVAGADMSGNVIQTGDRNVSTGGGDLVGRDQVIHGDVVYGDKVGGTRSRATRSPWAT